MTRMIAIPATALAALVLLAGCDNFQSAIANDTVRALDPGNVRPTETMVVQGQTVTIARPSDNEARLGATEWQVQVGNRWFLCGGASEEACRRTAAREMRRIESGGGY